MQATADAIGQIARRLAKADIILCMAVRIVQLVRVYQPDPMALAASSFGPTAIHAVGKVGATAEVVTDLPTALDV
jgi:hypothetical protein